MLIHKCLSETMKRLNAKRIAAVAAGAALLGVGLAFAGPVTFQNVQIIGSSGQPLVQVVVGSKAQITDGIAAANIAAAIGNLAYTSVGVTASVNTTNAQKVLHVSVSSPSGYSLANQQVYLNETGAAYASGSYAFGALIGSVLNRALQLGSPLNTKSLQPSSTGYSYPESSPLSLTASPQASPYSAQSFVPFTTVSGSTNGGGMSFSSFQSSGDNILEVTNAQLPGLLSNSGSYGETEDLWITGFPVYDQASGVNNFMVGSVGGAYQAVFNKPIQFRTGSNSINTAGISLLGENWTILNYELPGTSGFNQLPSAVTAGLSPTTAVAGGELQLASSLSPLTTVYVGQNISTPGNTFKVELTDIGQPNSNGVSPAGLDVYYQGALTNVTAASPGTTTEFNVSGHNLYVKVNQTFAGLYAYQKYAKLQLYSNVFNVTSGKVFNQTNDPGWYTTLYWTNTSSTNSKPEALQSIIIYNTTPGSLSPGQSFSFIENPAVWKFEFVGDNLGNNFDPLTWDLSTSGSITYNNTPIGIGSGLGNINNITEPAQVLTLTSSIPNAFSYAGQVSSSAMYDLTPYILTEDSVQTPNTVTVTLTNTDGHGGFVSATNPLTITIRGYPSSTAPSAVSNSIVFTATGGPVTMATDFYNITSIQLSQALPGVIVSVDTPGAAALATLTTGNPTVLYTQSGKVYDLQAPGSSIQYNQQNGQSPTSITLQAVSPAPSGTGSLKYFVVNATEYPVPGQTSLTDKLGFGIYNSTAGESAAPLFQLNQSSTGTRNNMSYTSTQNAIVNAPVGFRTERGSKVAAITPSSVTIDYAKAVDELQFVVAASTTSVSTTQHTYGPFGIGQSVNMPGVNPNVTVAKVTANVTLGSGSSYTITGLDNLTAVPSVTTATTPVLLKNLTTTPLVVLDSQANPASSLVLIGSGYVNTLSQQLQTSENITFTPTTQIVQAYGNKILVAGYTAGQTTAAANQFIQDLYAAASS